MWQVCSDSRIKPEINRDTLNNTAVFASCRHWGSPSEHQIWRLHDGACHELDPLTPTSKRPCKLALIALAVGGASILVMAGLDPAMTKHCSLVISL
jgi:hypothetical protein